MGYFIKPDQVNVKNLLLSIPFMGYQNYVQDTLNEIVNFQFPLWDTYKSTNGEEKVEAYIFQFPLWDTLMW